MVTIEENLLEVNKGLDKVEALNAELAQTLYGGDTGYRGFYDTFWDSYQDNGKRPDYSHAFAGDCWTEQTLRPKYDIVPSYSAFGIFGRSTIKVDLVEYLNNLGITLDFSKAQNTQQLFYIASFTRVGTIDVRSATNSIPVENMFVNCSNLVTIDKIYLKTGTNGEVSSNCFQNCTELVNVTFEGKITKTGLNMSWSKKLSKKSIENIIDCLSEASSGTSITLSGDAVDKAFETSEDKKDGRSSEEWKDLIATKNNWTINYK